MSNSAQPNYKSFPVQKSLYLFFGKATLVIILFLITIIYSRALSYEDYGKFQSIWMYTNLLNVIISFGITSLLLSSNLSTLAAFVRKYLPKIILAYSLLWIVTLGMFFWYEKNFTAATKYLLIFFVIIQSTGIVLETLLIKSHKEKVVFIVNFIYSLLFFGWHYYNLLREFSLQNLIEGIIILSIVKFIVMLFFKQNQDIPDGPPVNKLYFGHWIYLGLNDITGVFSKWIDKLLLVYLLTPADFALFFNGSFEIPLFGLLVSVIGSVMLIEISKSISAKEKVMYLFTESFHLLSVIVFPLFLFLLFFRTDLFALIFRHKYDASIPIFLISIFILPVRINNYGSILQYYQRGDKIMRGTILDICMAIILLVSLYPLLGTRGVALAIVIATWCQAIYYLWQSAKTLHTDILSLVPLKALSITMVITLLFFSCLYYGVHNFSIEVRLITGMIATTVLILTRLYFYFIKKRVTTNGSAA